MNEFDHVHETQHFILYRSGRVLYKTPDPSPYESADWEVIGHIEDIGDDVYRRFVPDVRRELESMDRAWEEYRREQSEEAYP